MTNFKHITAAVLAIAVLAALLAAPASARVFNSSSEPAAPAPVLRSHPVNSPAAETPLVRTVEVSDSSGFDWGAASIGAATVVGLGVLMTGAVLLNRRRHQPVAHRTAAA
jgi:hypothetical protein